MRQYSESHANNDHWDKVAKKEAQRLLKDDPDASDVVFAEEGGKHKVSLFSRTLGLIPLALATTWRGVYLQLHELRSEVLYT